MSTKLRPSQAAHHRTCGPVDSRPCVDGSTRSCAHRFRGHNRWNAELLRPGAGRRVRTPRSSTSSRLRQQLARDPNLSRRWARSRIGYALKTLLAEDDPRPSAVRLVEVLGETSRQPLVLQVPAPLRWLAFAQTVAGNSVRIWPSSPTTGVGPRCTSQTEAAPPRVARHVAALDGRRHDHPALSGLRDRSGGVHAGGQRGRALPLGSGTADRRRTDFMMATCAVVPLSSF